MTAPTAEPLEQVEDESRPARTVEAEALLDDEHRVDAERQTQDAPGRSEDDEEDEPGPDRVGDASRA